MRSSETQNRTRQNVLSSLTATILISKTQLSSSEDLIRKAEYMLAAGNAEGAFTALVSLL